MSLSSAPAATATRRCSAARSPGSTLKPLIYGLGFEAGLAHPETLIDDRPVSFGGYRPRNFDFGVTAIFACCRIDSCLADSDADALPPIPS